MSHPVLDELHRHAGGRPIYLACAPSITAWLSEEIAELLRRRRPAARIVNSCGRYGSGANWCVRWPRERDRYGGMIVLTVAAPLIGDEPETGPDIPGGHFLGQHVVQELTDLVKLGRPVAWLACLPGQRRLISRFRVGPAT